jgi:hypothetical protein
MAVDERARHELPTEVLGREEATALMTLLPPDGWPMSRPSTISTA